MLATVPASIVEAAFAVLAMPRTRGVGQARSDKVPQYAKSSSQRSIVRARMCSEPCLQR